MVIEFTRKPSLLAAYNANKETLENMLMKAAVRSAELTGPQFGHVYNHSVREIAASKQRAA